MDSIGTFHKSMEELAAMKLKAKCCLPLTETSPETPRKSEDMGWQAELSYAHHYPLGSLESVGHPA